MANWINPSVDLDQIPDGKYGLMRIYKDGATEMIPETAFEEFNVEDITIFETEGNYADVVKCFNKINTSKGIGHKQVIVEPIFMPDNKIQIMFSPPFSGLIIKN